jgi:hypothetical protein
MAPLIFAFDESLMSFGRTLYRTILLCFINTGRLRVVTSQLLSRRVYLRLQCRMIVVESALFSNTPHLNLAESIGWKWFGN